MKKLIAASLAAAALLTTAAVPADMPASIDV